MSQTMTDVAALTPQQRTILEVRLKEMRALSATLRSAIERQGRETNTFPLSFGQQRLWFVQGLIPDSYAYNVPHALRLKGDLNVSALEAAADEIVRRHEILRTTFVVRARQPVQLIAPPEPLKLTVDDLRELEPEEREAEAARLATAEARRIFYLGKGPLFRMRIMRLAADEFVLLVCMHHIVSDGWSFGVFYRELETLYTAFLLNQPSPLPDLPFQYADFACWQRKYLQGEVLEKQLEYWRDQLSQSLSPLELPTDRPRPDVQTFAGATESRILPKHIKPALEGISRQGGTTMFMTLLAAFQTLLYLYTGRQDIVVGTTTASRTRVDIEGLIGFFVNTLALRTDFSRNPSFREILARVRETSLGAYANQDLPFEKLVEELEPKHNPSYSPLFQVSFLFEGASSQSFKLSGLRVSAFPINEGGAKWDLALTLTDNQRGFTAFLEYNTDLYEGGTIRRMLGHLEEVLEEVVANPEVKLSELRLVSEAEWRQVVVENNATQQDYPLHLSLAELFEAQAEKTPDSAAVRFEGTELSYRELNRRANQLAHYLREQGVGAEQRVGVLMERSVEMVVSWLGVLKAGGVYVPLDPQYPKARLLTMVGDAEPKVILTQEEKAGRLGSSAIKELCLDAESELLQQYSEENLPSEVGPENAVYVIYTSGSTGKPKGVINTQRGVCNRLLWMKQAYELSREDRVLQKTPFSFDVSVWEFFWPLIHGACLVVAKPGGHQDAEYLRELIVGEKITAVHFVPSMLGVFLEAEGVERCTSVKWVLCSGEALPYEMQERFFERLGAELHNLYGPTEAAIEVTHWKCEANRARRSVPIGRPIANMQMYVLDEAMRVMPVGVSGELYIGGVGVARGYLGLADLTAERFVPDPFSSEPGKRLYRTGDLGRMQAEGEIEYVGRRDEQVKIRGFRIELGEIESALRQHAAVKESAVVVQGSGSEKRLIGYVVLNDTAALESSESPREAIREYLKRTLPDYMVPREFVTLEQLPLTPSGKIDRRALLRLDVSRHEVATPYAEPRSGLEKRLAGFWREVLKVERVGLHDNFFDIGGHSLVLIQLHSKLREELKLELSAVDLFKYPTIASLAEYLKSLGANADDGERKSQDRLTQTYPRSDVGPRSPKQEGTDIAIIGLSGRFPCAANIAEFWENLRNGVEAVREFSEADLCAAGVSEEMFQQDRYVRMGTVLDKVEWFDAEFFGITPREAQAMDPQQRLFLECASEAMADAGYDPSSYDLPIGMFAGAATNSYMFQLMSNRELFRSIGGFQTKLLNDKDFLTSRVSYKLGLKGPSLTVQTACSTSLVAVHLACQSLLCGECSMALAGGATIVLPQRSGYLYQEGGLLSPDGHCRTFDARAAGIVGGSGVGIVLLKPLSTALADGDSIRAVIKGSAINNDGALKVGYTAPSVAGQAAAIAKAHAVAGVHPESISYIEAHGTATKLGDPIEIAALTQVFRAQTSARQFCAIGSVKSNIGHLDAAAGVAGLIKTVLALEHEELPASLHYEEPNPEIDFAGSPFYVNAQLQKWPRREGEARRAGVSSFGMGGTNAHLILEEAPAVKQGNITPKHGEWQVLSLSARTADSLTKAKQQLATHLEKHREESLANIAYTLQVGRRDFTHRAAVVCRDAVDAAAILRSNDPKDLLESLQECTQRPVAFLFPGIGDHYPNMAAGIYAAEETFRAEVDRCAEFLKEHLGCDLREVFYPSQGHADQSDVSSQPLDLRKMLNRGSFGANQTKQLNDTLMAQPAVFVIEYATAKLLMKWGIKPEAMVGYSIGEYVAACLAGVLSIEDALFLVAKRARLIQTLPAGAMLAVPVSEEDVDEYLSEQVWLAASNNSALCVLAGSEKAIHDCEQKARSRDLACRRLPTTHPFHSPLLAPVAEELTGLVRKVTLKEPKIAYISNVTGKWITTTEAMNPHYWAKHMCQTVRFADGLEELWREPNRILIEVGPGQSLTSLALQERVPGTEQVALPTIRNSYELQPDMGFLMGTMAKLWLAGVTPDWKAVHLKKPCRRVPLPTYNFDRKYYWLPQPNGNDHQPSVQGGKRSEIASWFYLPSWKRSSPLSLLESAGVEQQKQNWLLFLDEGGVGSEIAARLESAGHSVVKVSAGSIFRVCSPSSYTIHRARRDDYDCLICKLQEVHWNPDRIVHLWGLESDSEDLSARERFNNSQTSGFYSLLYLAQALGRYGRGSLQIAVLSNQMQEVTGTEMLSPNKATMLGPCKVIPQEYPEIRCQSIDVILPLPGRERDKLVQLLIAEFESKDYHEAIAYRGGYRWIQHFEPVRLEVKGHPAQLRERGVYLLIGGLGKIGTTLAEYLAKQTNANLVLTSRSGLPPRNSWEEYLEKWGQTEIASRIKKVLALEALGAEVSVLKADVADRDEMHKVIQGTYRQFGALNGVIYLAGLLGAAAFSPIQETSQAECEPNFQAKGHGLYVLEEVLDGLDLDFCVLFSSLSSVLGGLGFTAYAAANAFMDAFVRKHNRISIKPWISEDWDTWLVGRSEAHSLDFKATQSDLNMTPEEAIAAFQAILSAGMLTQIVVSVGDLQSRREKWIKQKTPSEDNSGAESSRFHSVPRPGLRNAFVAPRDEIEKDIAEMWQEVLGIHAIGIYDNFFELGGHSLLGTQIISRIRNKFHEDISVRTLFTSPTIKDLAEVIVQRKVEQVDGATLTQLIGEVRQSAD
jgi:amino acid adenylation domain-containing protein